MDHDAAEPAQREPCVRCGMTANLDPSLHAERYDHNPAVWRDGRVVEFCWHSYSFGHCPDRERPCGRTRRW